MKPITYTNSLTTLILLGSLSVFPTACSTVSENSVVEPKVRISNLPPSVKYTEPKLKKAKDANETKAVLEEYERANALNRNAIQAAKSHNKKLQDIYNKPVSKEPEENKNPFNPSNWKLW